MERYIKRGLKGRFRQSEERNRKSVDSRRVKSDKHVRGNRGTESERTKVGEK